MTPHDGRALLATMIQGSTVDLFQTWCIAVAPAPTSRRDMTDVTCRALMGQIQFSAPAMQGTLGLLVPKDVFELVRQDPSRPFSGVDWVQENVNQLLGRLKSRLLPFQVTLRLGLPQLLTEQALQSSVAKGPLGVYRFRTLRGEVTVILNGKVDYSKLEYSGVAASLTEGDIIVF
jgi:hypothetical protein